MGDKEKEKKIELVNQKFNYSLKLQEFFDRAYVEDDDAKLNIQEFKEAKEHSEELLFMCFWYLFVHSQDDSLKELLGNTKIKLKDEEVDILNVSQSISEINSYAFEIVRKLELNDEIENEVLKAGKILLDLEWIIELIENKQFKKV